MSRSTLRNFLIASVCLLTTVGVSGFSYKMISDKEETLKTQLAAIKIGNELEKTYHHLQKISEDSKSDREQLNNYFLPQVSESITFLNQVEALAPQNGITLKTDALEEGSDKKTKDKWVNAQFTLSGTQSDVDRFVTILENLPYVSEITSLQMTDRSENNWEAKVTIRVFIANYEK
ncbi:MAG: hypothetical protein AAB618_00340 [Patescibacteria group bacterium]